MAAYKWKTQGLFNVDPEKAGRFLEDIYNEEGRIDPSTVVEKSKPKDALLHNCFEWDDAKAAKKFRESQARTLIANVVIVSDDQKQSFTRAFVHVEQNYQPIQVVLESHDKTEELLQSALRELRTFENKYRELSQLAPVFKAIQEVA